jgi:2-methylcitrate dehydratase PrpD
MQDKHEKIAVERRLFLGTSALTLSALTTFGLPGVALAQQPPAGAAKATAAEGKKLTQVIADFVAGFDLKAVPPDVINRARICFIDTMGVTLAGSREEVAHIALDMVKLEGSTPSAGIVGQSLRASPQLAALANGVAAHAMDYDFTFLSGQAVSPLIPAILPVAETAGATPAECVAAFIVGCEVAGRIVRANFNASNIGGWHTAGMVGVIAAAAACGKLMKLPADKIAEAIGIATSMASGIAVNYGTMTKPLHSGHAARDGVMAALLASRGFTSHASAFEGGAGYFATFGRGLNVSLEPFKDLGRRYDLVGIGVSLKAYPCGGRGHTAIEAALALRDRVGTRLADITNIHCSLTKSSAQRVGVEYPSTVEAAKFSAAYVIAYSLVHGTPRIPAFTEAALNDARVKAVARLVTASADPDLPDGMGESPAKLKITLKDGQVFEQRRDYATGSNQVPMTQAQVEEKFLDCAAQALSADAAKKILAALNALPDRPSFSDVWPLLRPA